MSVASSPRRLSEYTSTELASMPFEEFHKLAVLEAAHAGIEEVTAEELAAVAKQRPSQPPFMDIAVDDLVVICYKDRSYGGPEVAPFAFKSQEDADSVIDLIRKLSIGIVKDIHSNWSKAKFEPQWPEVSQMRVRVTREIQSSRDWAVKTEYEDLWKQWDALVAETEKKAKVFREFFEKLDHKRMEAVYEREAAFTLLRKRAKLMAIVGDAGKVAKLMVEARDVESESELNKANDKWGMAFELHTAQRAG